MVASCLSLHLDSKAKIPMAKKTLHMFVNVNDFLKAKDTHYAKASLLAPLLLLNNVHTLL
jgi:hypothetical protein